MAMIVLPSVLPSFRRKYVGVYVVLRDCSVACGLQLAPGIQRPKTCMGGHGVVEQEGRRDVGLTAVVRSRVNRRCILGWAGRRNGCLVGWAGLGAVPSSRSGSAGRANGMPAVNCCLQRIVIRRKNGDW
jgi:hypothetical protein